MMVRWYFFSPGEIMQHFSCPIQPGMKFVMLLSVKICVTISWHLSGNITVMVRWYFFLPGEEVMQHFSCPIQLSMKFVMLISVKMPTIVGILTFTSMVNTLSESLKAIKVFFFSSQLKFHAHLS